MNFSSVVLFRIVYFGLVNQRFGGMISDKILEFLAVAAKTDTIFHYVEVRPYVGGWLGIISPGVNRVSAKPFTHRMGGMFLDLLGSENMIKNIYSHWPKINKRTIEKTMNYIYIDARVFDLTSNTRISMTKAWIEAEKELIVWQKELGLR